MVKTIIWAVALVVVLIVAGALYFSLQQSTAVETAIISINTVRRSVRGSGIIEGLAELQLKFGLAGQVVEVTASEGHEVSAGDTLAQLNSAWIDMQIQEQEAALKEATARAEMVKAPKAPEVIVQAEEKWRQAAEEIKVAQARLEALRDPPAPPPAPASQIDEAQRLIEANQQKLALAQAALKQVKAGATPDEVAIAQAKVEFARAEYEGAGKLLGDFKAGTILFSPHNESKSQLEINVDTTRKKLELAQAEFDKVNRGPKKEEVEAAEARVSLAKLDVDSAEAAKLRMEKPVPPPPAPGLDIKAAEVLFAQAQARERQAKAAVDELKRPTDGPEIRVAEAAQEKAERALSLLKLNKAGLELRAPFSGLVTRRLVEPGSIVAPTEPILSMVDFSKKRVRAEFDVVWLKEVKPGMRATFKSRAFAKEELEGKVLDLGKVGSRKIFLDDPREAKGGEVVEVLLEVEEPKSALKKQVFAVLKPGLRVDVDVTLDTRANVVSAPKSYIAHKDDKEFVWRAERNSATGKLDAPKLCEVRCGLRDEGYVEIIQGLSVGDVIVKPPAPGR